MPLMPKPARKSGAYDPEVPGDLGELKPVATSSIAAQPSMRARYISGHVWTDHLDLPQCRNRRGDLAC